MLISIVIFTFGLIITFIVALGLINANEMQIRQRTKDFQFDAKDSRRSSFRLKKSKQSPKSRHHKAALREETMSRQIAG
jgi:hypothetical protein